METFHISISDLGIKKSGVFNKDSIPLYVYIVGPIKLRNRKTHKKLAFHVEMDQLIFIAKRVCVQCKLHNCHCANHDVS